MAFPRSGSSDISLEPRLTADSGYATNPRSFIHVVYWGGLKQVMCCLVPTEKERLLRGGEGTEPVATVKAPLNIPGHVREGLITKDGAYATCMKWCFV